MNGVIIQFFHWYHPGQVWNDFKEKSEYLSSLGITAAWLPPAVKCNNQTQSRGYDVYDLYDLGEFDQKGGVPTRYGTKEEYIQAIEKAHKLGISVYADIVLNHRMGGDEREEITVHEVKGDNRNEMINEPFQTEAFTKFTFPGRDGKYSEFIWDYHCISGVDRIWKDDEELEGTYKIHNEYGLEWNDAVSHQMGNYDYLMGADTEFRNPHVVQELKNWTKWYVETTKVDGFRLDAIKHISSDFLKEWVEYIRAEINDNFFMVGELWKDDVGYIAGFSETMNHSISLFDVPLHYNFHKASLEGNSYNLSEILKDSFLELNPVASVSFVDNHDTQKLQGLESAVEDWFKPLAYALILLSENAYPCIFYPDLFGAEYTDKNSKGEDTKITMPPVKNLPELLEARQKFGFGEQINYFDHPNCVAWVRKGTAENPGCVVLLSNSEEGYKDIELGEDFASASYSDFLQNREDIVTLDESGKGTFRVNPGSVSVWVKND